MKKGWKRFFLFLLVIILCVVGYGVYVWNKPRPQVEDAKGIEITATALFDSFTNNETNARKMYVDKAMQVTGQVSEVKKNQAGATVIILKSDDPIFGVNCTFKVDPGVIQKGTTITFKGFCKEFNSDVYVTEGILIKQ